MKNLHLSLPLMLLLIYSFIAFPAKSLSKQHVVPPDSLSAYTGKYQMKQGMQTVFADVYIENGKLTAKASTGEVLILDRVDGDNFKISNQNVPIKFMRNKDNQVSQIMVNGSIAWLRADEQPPAPSVQKNPFNPADFLGTYQITANGQVLKIEVTLKSGQLWATQLWDNGTSTLDFLSADKFMVNALSLPLGFIRNKDGEVTQLLFNNHDVFRKVKN